MRRTTPRVTSLDTLRRQQEGVPRSASTRPSSKISRMPWTSWPRAYIVYLAHQGATTKMPRWTTTCHQALVEAPRKGRQGNKLAVIDMKRSIRMTFGDTPPIKSVNVDMRRRRRQRRILWCPLVLQLPSLTRSWPTSTTSSSKSNVDAGRNMVSNVRPQPRRRPSQALLMIRSLHQVPPPQWPLYGKMKTSHATIAKAKTMIHENVPISCAQIGRASCRERVCLYV